MATLTVGDVAQRAGLSPKAVRLYEQRGLIRAARRTESGYRTYDEGDVEVLRFIRQARALGLSLGEIKQILDLQQGGARPCGTVLQLLDAHVKEIDDTIASLRALRRTLVRARDAARVTRDLGQDAVICHIIEAQPAV